MKHLIIMVLFMIVIIQMTNISTVVLPVAAKQQEEELNTLRNAAIKVGIGNPGTKVINAVTVASSQTGLSQEFLLALTYTESMFKKNAISSKNYKGLLQIPHNVFYEDANILIGARIFLEKLVITKGNYRNAIILFKGWPLDDPKGRREADKVITLTSKLKREII